MTPEHLIVIADALSKSVVLARDEREVASVFDLSSRSHGSLPTTAA